MRQTRAASASRAAPGEAGIPVLQGGEEVNVPAAARSYLEGDGLTLAEEVANETLAGPLELLGYRLGTLQAHYDATTGELRLDLQAGLLPTNPPPALRGTAPALPTNQQP